MDDFEFDSLVRKVKKDLWDFIDSKRGKFQEMEEKAKDYVDGVVNFASEAVAIETEKHIKGNIVCLSNTLNLLKSKNVSGAKFDEHGNLLEVGFFPSTPDYNFEQTQSEENTHSEDRSFYDELME